MHEFDCLLRDWWLEEDGRERTIGERSNNTALFLVELSGQMLAPGLVYARIEHCIEPFILKSIHACSSCSSSPPLSFTSPSSPSSISHFPLFPGGASKRGGFGDELEDLRLTFQHLSTGTAMDLDMLGGPELAVSPTLHRRSQGTSKATRPHKLAFSETWASVPPEASRAPCTFLAHYLIFYRYLCVAWRYRWEWERFLRRQSCRPAFKLQLDGRASAAVPPPRESCLRALSWPKSAHNLLNVNAQRFSSL